MFYCDDCAKKKNYPTSIGKSIGKCELCGRDELCNDISCSSLPESPDNKVTLNKQQECLKAINVLYLEVDKSIADDIKQKFLDALDEVRNEKSHIDDNTKYKKICGNINIVCKKREIEPDMNNNFGCIHTGLCRWMCCEKC